jgi:hypothetical protein
LALVDLKPVCKELIHKVKAVINIKVEEKNKIKLQPISGELKTISFLLLGLKPHEVGKSGLVKTFHTYQKHDRSNATRDEADVVYDWVRQTFNRCGENFIDEFVKLLKDRGNTKL